MGAKNSSQEVDQSAMIAEGGKLEKSAGKKSLAFTSSAAKAVLGPAVKNAYSGKCLLPIAPVVLLRCTLFLIIDKCYGKQGGLF